MNFLKYLIAIGFLTISVETSASFSEILENFQNHLGSSITLNKELLMKGCSLIEKTNTDMVERYKLGVSFRKNEVKEFESKTSERLLLQMLCFEGITTDKEDYSLKAMHNLGETFLRLGEMIPNTQETKCLKASFFQDAYYFFSLASFTQSKNNMQTIVNDGKISFIIGNPKFQKPSTPPTKKMVESSFNKTFKEKMDDFYSSNLPIFVENTLTNMEKTKGIKFTPKQKEMLSKTLLFTVVPTLEKEINQNLPKLQKEILSKPYDLEAEQKRANEITEVENISYTPETLNDLTHLYGQLVLTIRKTPKFTPGELKPVTIFLGRSTSWLVEIQKLLNETFTKDLIFKHALVSGLKTQTYTIEQKEGYKGYLDFLDFKKIEKDRPILVVDVAETGNTLKCFGQLLNELYGFKNIQSIAMMSYGSTVNLERARVIHLTGTLSKILFAKHSEKARFCLYSQLYPSQWENWEKYVKGFQPHEDALQLKKQVEEWIKSGKYKESLKPILGML